MFRGRFAVFDNLTNPGVYCAGEGKKGIPPIRSWLDTNIRPGFRGSPVATVAFYRLSDKLATKVVVSVIVTESDEPDALRCWFSQGDMDVRHDAAIGEQILAFLKPHAPRAPTW